MAGAELSLGIGALRVRSTAARYSWAHGLVEPLQSLGTDATCGWNRLEDALPAGRLCVATPAVGNAGPRATRFTCPPLARTSLSSGVLSANSLLPAPSGPVDSLFRLV